jgi:Phosphoribosyl-ATP pyrophosphohydrolase
MSTLTREEYLQLRYQGKGRTEIMKTHFKNTAAFYTQLGQWGIREKDAEEKELELMSIEQSKPASLPQSNEPGTSTAAQSADDQESPSSLAKQLEQLILQHTQPKTESVTNKIKKWAVDRNLHTADPNKQMLKLGEEYGELCRSLAVRDMSQVIDAIGDIYVVLTVLSLQLGMDVEECIKRVYEEIKDRKGQMIDGIFVKETDMDERHQEQTM